MIQRILSNYTLCVHCYVHACPLFMYVFACVFWSAAVGRICVILSGAKDCCSGNTVLLL